MQDHVHSFVHSILDTSHAIQSPIDGTFLTPVDVHTPQRAYVAMNSKKMQLLREEDRETLFRFIEHYKQIPHLWDPNNQHYKNKHMRLKGLSILASEYNMEIKSVTRKIKSLRTYFAHQHNKVVQMRAGIDPNYESPWVAYKHLLFIAGTYKDNKDPLTTTESAPSTSSKIKMPRKYVRKFPNRSLCTQEQFDAAKKFLEQGKSQRFAAAQVGINESTLRKRLKLNAVATSMGRAKYKTREQEAVFVESAHLPDETTSQATVKSEVHTDSESDAYSDTEPTIEANIEEISIDTTTNDQFEYNPEVIPKKRKTETKQKTEPERDEVTIFGELMMYKIRKLNSQNILIAQNKINNILFELEMEEMKGNH